MSKALKCDICGSLFRFYDHIPLSLKDKMAPKPNYMRLTYIDCGGGWYTNEEYDICPDCYNAIVKTIDARRKTINPMDDDLK